MTNKNILVAGGAGYIGSHMTRLLLASGYSPVIFDNLSKGYKEFIPQGVPFFKGDLRNRKDLEDVFTKYDIDTVMHFAAVIVVPESVSDPLKYYENNVLGAINLAKVMVEKGIKNFIFSSTAAVYGEPKEVPITEDSPLIPLNPYGVSKLMMEEILRDSSKAYDFRYIALRYFNVAGADPSGEIGPGHKPATHLMACILKFLTGEYPQFTIYGNDYPTPDGTCVRDYIHVLDLCAAHLLAIEHLHKTGKSDIFNLGTGNGFTVKQVVDMAEKVTGKKVNFKMGPRRPGDAASVYACSDKAKKILGWQPKQTLEDMVRTAWNWELSERRKRIVGDQV